MLDNYNVEVSPSVRGRRKRENKSGWKKKISSVKCNSAAGKQPKISCVHQSSKLCQANELSQEDIHG